MMRGLGLLMLIVGAVFVFVVPYYQQHFTNFIITEQTVYAEGAALQSFDLELSPNDAPLEIVVTAQFTYQGDASGGRLSVPLLVDGPDGFLLTDIVEVTDAHVEPGASNTGDAPLQRWTHEHYFDDITVEEAAIYTFSLGPLVEEGYEAKLIDIAVIGNAPPPWPDLTPLGWAVMAVGGFATVFGGRRKVKSLPKSKTARIGRRKPTKKAEPDQPVKKWGRD